MRDKRLRRLFVRYRERCDVDALTAVFDATAPALLAHGTNDANVPVEHAIQAAERISSAELLLVEEGHHALSLSRGFGPVATRQLELAHR